MSLPWIIHGHSTKQRQNCSAPRRASFILSKIKGGWKMRICSWEPSQSDLPFLASHQVSPSFSIPVVFNSFLYLTRLLGMNRPHLSASILSAPSHTHLHLPSISMRSFPPLIHLLLFLFHLLLTLQRSFLIKHLFYPASFPSAQHSGAQ